MFRFDHPAAAVIIHTECNLVIKLCKQKGENKEDK